MKNIKFAGFIGRFTVTHVITYLIFGILFMFISDYFTFFAENLDYMRDGTSLFVQLAPVFQIIRGALLALPFYF